jgi:hypothetical protein
MDFSPICATYVYHLMLLEHPGGDVGVGGVEFEFLYVTQN